jgi:hypothetical protein
MCVLCLIVVPLPTDKNPFAAQLNNGDDDDNNNNNNNNNNKLHGFSLQPNYTERATAACRQSYCKPLRIEGATWSAQRIPTAVFLVFLDRRRYFFFQVAPQLYSRG